MLRVLQKQRASEVISLSLGLIPNTVKGSMAFGSHGVVLLLQTVPLRVGYTPCIGRLLWGHFCLL